MRPHAIGLLAATLVLTTTTTAAAQGVLPYWGAGARDQNGQCLIRKARTDHLTYGRYTLYSGAPSNVVATAENIAVSRGEDCTLFFDITVDGAAMDALLVDDLYVRLEVCDSGSSSSSCGFSDLAAFALDEPVDSIVGVLWAQALDEVDGMQSQVNTLNAFAPSCGPNEAINAFDIDAASYQCTDPLATQAALDAETDARIQADELLQDDVDTESAARIAEDDALHAGLDAENAGRIAADDALETALDAHVTSDLDLDPTNELQSWSTLPGIPAGFADGVDDDTTYDGRDFALSTQGCPGNEKVVGIDNEGQILCAPDIDSVLARVDNYEMSGRACSSVSCSRAAQTVPTGGTSCSESIHCTATNNGGHCTASHTDYSCSRTGTAEGESKSEPTGMNFQACAATNSVSFLTSCREGSWDTANKRCYTSSVAASCSIPSASCTTVCSNHGSPCTPAGQCTVGGASSSNSSCTEYATAVCATPVY